MSQERTRTQEQAKISDLQNELDEANREIAYLQASLAEITGSRAWRTTAFFRRGMTLLRKIRGAVFLRYQRFQLSPSSGLVNEDGAWRADEDDPHYELGLAGIAITSGWHRLKLYSKDRTVNHEAVIYFNTGAGYDDKNKLDFSAFGDTGSAVFNAKAPVISLRLDPIRGKGTFEFQGAGIRPITGLELVLFYFRRYLDKKRTMGVSLRAAIRLKINQLGGWRNLSFKSLINHASAYEMMQGHGVNEDIVVASYKEWIDSYESTYFASRYSLIERKTLINSVLVLFVREASSDYLFSVVADNRSAFAHIVIAVADTSFAVEHCADYTLIRYCDQASLYRNLLDSNAEGITTYYSVVTAPVLLGEFFAAALQAAVDVSASPLDVIYFDSDVIDEAGNRSNHYFKPEWDLDLYLANQYVGPLCVFSEQALRSASAKLAPDYSGDPIAGLILSSIDTSRSRRVYRVPEVHYHLRSQGGQNCTHKQGGDAVDQSAVAQLLPAYNYEHQGDGSCRIVPALPEKEASVSIVIPTKDHADLLRQCIDSVFSLSTYQNYSLIVVDNGSTEEGILAYLSQLQDDDRVEVLRSPGPFNFSALNNLAVAESDADVVVLLNDDTEVISHDWLQELVRYALLPWVGCVGAKLYYQNNTIQHAGVVLGVNGLGAHCHRTEARDASGYNGRLRVPQSFSAVTAACLAVRRDLYLEVGGLNERDLAVAFNDVDFCLKLAEEGYSNVWTPYAELYHFESLSRGEDRSPEQLARTASEASYIMRRWGALLKNDPAYNPNLTLTTPRFDLSTRYVTNFSRLSQAYTINPCQQPYYYESNIERANTVQRGRLDLPSTPQERPEGLSIIILTLEKFDLINGLLRSLAAAARKLADANALKIEIIVGDTGSKGQDVLDLYRELDADITLVTDLNYHFSRCNNALFRDQATYATVLFLNNDIVFDDASLALSSMYDYLQSAPNVGVLGAYMYYPTNYLQHGGVDLYVEGENKGLCYHPGHNTPLSPPKPGFAKVMPAVTGACLMMEASLFERCDCFDESYEVEAQDVDLCLKVSRFGFTTSVFYAGHIIHFENATRPQGESNQKDRARFIRKWSGYQEVMLSE